MENRPDFSNYLVHFTKDKLPCSKAKTNPAKEFAVKVSALDRLINILKQKQIRSSELTWIHKNAVCFTECIWGSLLSHAQVYSSYGIGFTKEYIFQKGGNPVFYVRPKLHEHIKQISEEVKPFLTPFQPEYSKDPMAHNIKRVDYSHEREWRVPMDFDFEYKDVAFIIVKSLNDLKLPKLSPLVKQIGESKFIVMDNYKKVEQIWPIHKIEVGESIKK